MCRNRKICTKSCFILSDSSNNEKVAPANCNLTAKVLLPSSFLMKTQVSKTKTKANLRYYQSTSKLVVIIIIKNGKNNPITLSGLKWELLLLVAFNYSIMLETTITNTSMFRTRKLDNIICAQELAIKKYDDWKMFENNA